MPNPLEMEFLMENRLTTGSYPLPCLMIRGDIGWPSLSLFPTLPYPADSVITSGVRKSFQGGFQSFKAAGRSRLFWKWSPEYWIAALKKNQKKAVLLAILKYVPSFCIISMYEYVQLFIPLYTLYFWTKPPSCSANPIPESLRPWPFSLGSRIGIAPQDVEPRQSSAPSSAAGSRCPHAWHASHEKPESDSRKTSKNPTKNSCKLLFLLFDPLWGSSVFEWLSRENVETAGIPMAVPLAM